jgi:hypothetical protein
MTDALCSTLSREVGEPLAGSAAGDTDRYLVLEHDLPWGPKGVEDSQLPPDVLACLRELGQHRGLRVQLVRRAQGEGAGLRVYLAESGASPVLYSLTLASLDELPALPLAAWLRGEQPPPGVRESEPLYLVCVHGKRDRCCALLGLPVYRALVERVGARALQTTHLGGHRFAATLLTLPDGICYGRVQVDETERLVEATERGELYDLARVRGRTAYGSEAQAAEVLLREQLGELRLTALTLRDVQVLEGGRTEVRFLAADGTEHTVALVRERLPAAPPSCGAADKPVSALVRARSA